MALVLLLSIANDYGGLLAESAAARRSVTLLAVWMAAMTTLCPWPVSGERSASGSQFRLTMLIGILARFFCSAAREPGKTENEGLTGTRWSCRGSVRPRCVEVFAFADSETAPCHELTCFLRGWRSGFRFAGQSLQLV